MASKRKKFVIIDGNALIHRAFHALPPLTTAKGEVVNAVYGFTSILLKVLKEIKPEYIAATFDLAAPTFRHAEYEEYKAKRIKAPQELYDQIPRVKDVVRAFNIPIFEQEGFEADDLIGTVVQKFHDKPVDVIIVTGDMDTLQLVNDHTKVYTLKKGVGETTMFGPAEVRERYGVDPDQIIDYKALRGDPSDNIPGVPGIGEKTATELLQTFYSVKELYTAIDANSKKLSSIKPRILDLLKEHRTKAELSYKLATIVTDVPVDFVLNDCTTHSYDRQKVIDLFQKLEFKSLLAKLPTMTLFQNAETPAGQQSLMPTTPKLRENLQYTIVTKEPQFRELLKQLSSISNAAVDTETTGTDVIDEQLLGVSVAWKEGKAFYIDLSHNNGKRWLQKLQPFLTSSSAAKFGHNMKFDYQILKQAGVEMGPLTFDSLIASYLLSPGGRQHDLDTLIFSEFGYEMMPITELIGAKATEHLPMRDVPVDKLGWYSCEDADFTLRLVKKLRTEIAEKSLTHLMDKVEMPLIPILADMELAGVKIDSEFLQSMSKNTLRKLGKLETSIYEAAGTQFNINSPQQLKEILFDTLQISTDGIGKTKTGFSTAAAELDKMKEKHPIIAMIVEYRELAKLRSTYLEALPKLVKKKTGRVHTDYNQAVTSTGRLSSSNPNLQNIPIRTELGREIRKAFIADRGFHLLSADYSQIELRLAAVLANDTKMLEAFRKGEDIHARTAADIHGIPLDKVTKEIRRTAKEVNFGVLYGMGVYGLAGRTGISRDQAKEFIDRYFSVYTGIAEYVEKTKELARSRGYVETLFGRRRYITDINSSNHQLRSAAERMAVNMPIQGTAADLMKLAMIAISRELPKLSSATRMILQVHDELVFEVPQADVEKVGKFVQETMEMIGSATAPSLRSVPIVTDVSVGKNWGEMGKISP